MLDFIFVSLDSLWHVPKVVVMVSLAAPPIIFRTLSFFEFNDFSCAWSIGGENRVGGAFGGQ